MGPEDVRKALVVGAGAMGNSIALVFARAGIGVGLVDVGRDALDRAMGLIESGLGALVDAGKVGRGEIGTVLGRIHPDTDLEAAAQGVDFVVEAVPEVPEVKKEVFTRLDELCPEEVIIASNTSGLDIFSFAEVARPGRLLIAHWFLPPHIVPLVEVVPGPDTAPGAVSSTAALMQRLGKVPVVLKGFTRAFIVNKIQNMIALAVFELLGSGLVEPQDIDRAVKNSLGIRLPIVGVVQNLDFTGLDLVLDVMKSYGFMNEFIAGKVEEGSLGAKTGKGIYDYGGRAEAEILAGRDRRYLEMLDQLEAIGAFEPI
ncbi:MAG: 3-hydroxyacyl-CoA dehydrogenase family protein [Actinomycetota bacterium]|nr:3-hydroxyacyl-CoA dehydrogenase family protein [Actinomycetota bacterium]MDD5665931.1 3-hydroxyacyl-CoA dehydrogenase family protein [Actinomycetota bacterium]